MDKETKIRVALTVVICSIAFIGWNMFFAPQMSPKPLESATMTQNSTSIAPSANAINVTTTSTTPSEQIAKEAPIVLKTNGYTVAFDPTSGDVRYISMDGYKNGATVAPTFIDNKYGNNYSTIKTAIEGRYNLERTDNSNGSVLTFTAENSQIRVTKQYTVNNDSFQIPIQFKVENLTDTPLSVPVVATVGPGLGDGFDKGQYVFTGPMIRNAKKTVSDEEGDVKKTVSLDAPLWGGYTSKYFLFVVVGDGFERADIENYSDSAVTKLFKTLTVNGNSSEEIKDLFIYAGPKTYTLLKSLGNELNKAIDYGIFSFIAIPMGWVMRSAYDMVGNYGFAIIILTILVKILTLPLTWKSMKSMKAMSKLQPEIVKLKEKYKEEPQKMNAATMELYRAHKVNPMSGCLPMVVQLPVFFALYKTLLVSIELKGAPFLGWLVDLSVKDPYYITPILMGATMFLQQKMTPTTADPTQQKIFLLMPVVFTFLFLNFPSGLVIYWLTNNVLSITQQYIMNKQSAVK